MIQTAFTAVREWYRSETNWRHVASDLLGTMIALTAAFVLTGYLSLQELATGDWTVESLRFGVGGPLDTLALALIAAPFAAPVFYAAWQLADRRYGTRRVPQELAVWLGFGVVGPGIGVLAYLGVNITELIEALTVRGVGEILVAAQGPLTELFGGALALALFPVLFTGVYHRLSTGRWTPRTRELHVTVAVVAVVVLAAVGASAALAPPTNTDGEEYGWGADDPSDPASFRDGDHGPAFSPRPSNNQSYSSFQSGDGFACGEIAPPPEWAEDYQPKQTAAGGKSFEVATGQIATKNGTVTLDTVFSVRLSNATLGDAAVISTGYYDVETADEDSNSVSVSHYDTAIYGTNHRGMHVRMENVESVHVYVDVVRDGEVHRYTTKICPNANGSDSE